MGTVLVFVLDMGGKTQNKTDMCAVRKFGAGMIGTEGTDWDLGCEAPLARKGRSRGA